LNELDQERRYYDHLQESMREENEPWELEEESIAAGFFEEEVRQQMEDDQRVLRDRLRDNSNETLLRSVYFNHEDEVEEEDRQNEEELYENDQDDLGFDVSYQDNVQASRDGLSTRRFELALNRAAIVQRLLRYIQNYYK
jgi:hypothetical protein